MWYSTRSRIQKEGSGRGTIAPAIVSGIREALQVGRVSWLVRLFDCFFFYIYWFKVSWCNLDGVMGDILFSKEEQDLFL
jgi:hypothetical protein